MWLKLNALQVFIRDLNLGRIFSPVEFGFHPKTVTCRCFSDQLHDDLVAHQRPPSPIHADMREKSMLYLVVA